MPEAQLVALEQATVEHGEGRPGQRRGVVGHDRVEDPVPLGHVVAREDVGLALAVSVAGALEHADDALGSLGAAADPRLVRRRHDGGDHLLARRIDRLSILRQDVSPQGSGDTHQGPLWYGGLV